VPFAYLDVGWENWMLAVEYEGDHHRTDPSVFAKDIHIQRVKRLAPEVR
jgi:predicted ATPase